MIANAGRIRYTYSRACLKIHFRDLHAPLCGIFARHSVNVARYASLKSPTNWDAHLMESNFQTRSSAFEIQRLVVGLVSNMR